jgi:hypothetical protein
VSNYLGGQLLGILNAPSGIVGTFSIVNRTHINSKEQFTATNSSTHIVLKIESEP